MSKIKLGIGLYRHMLNDQHFAFARQCGCTHIIVHLADYYSGQIVTATDDKTNYGIDRAGEDIWSLSSMMALQEMAHRHNLEIYGIENFSPADWYDVLLDGPNRTEQMEHLKEIIRNAGLAGIKSFGYNFSIAGVWGHQKQPHARGGALGTCFDASLINTQAPVKCGEVWNMTYAAGNGQDLPVIRSEQLWDRLKRFLQELLPVAEKAGVVLALHPDRSPDAGSARTAASCLSVGALSKRH